MDGLVIADFSRVLAGPLAAMLLGDLGADVIKIERPGSGDDTRAWGPPYADGDSTYYLAANRNKRSIEVDLADDAGQSTALAIIDRADVLIENFSPGTMGRLGLGWPVAHERNPGLVYCSISGFGPHGGAHLPGYDFLVQATGGLMSITGAHDGDPTKVGVALVDVMAGLHAVIGIQAALRERDRSGLGQHVETSLLSSLLSGLVNQASGFVNAGVVPHRDGNRHPSITPYELLEAADGMLALAVGNDRQFGALCRELGLPGMPEDERFATNAARVGNREALITALGAVLRTRTVGHWTTTLTAVNVPCGPVNDLAAAFRLADRLGLEPIRQIPRADGAVARQVANPLTLSATPPSYRRPPPRLGEHTAEVRRWLSTTPPARTQTPDRR